MIQFPIYEYFKRIYNDLKGDIPQDCKTEG